MARFFVRVIAVVILAATAAPAAAHAQAPRDSRMQVTVVDPSGAVVPEATVTVVGLEPATQAVAVAPGKTNDRGVAILDGVHLNLDDDDGFTASCRQGAELGFDGKTLIHPKTIAAANAAFGPTVNEVAWSRKIIAAHAQAVARGQGVVVVDGQLIEVLHVEDAKRTVALAEAIAARGQQAS